MDQKMFCFQCQETARCKGISCVTTALRKEGKSVPKDINHLVTMNLFTTITNANFNKEFIKARIQKTLEEKQKLLEELSDTGNLPEAATWDGTED